ncbi:hypothetical protein DFH06DRAFT_1447978 [Mycena polygramma]|nr:hypothetical protein DFH06DRAFT_1447978 [Mycena polygramma]
MQFSLIALLAIVAATASARPLRMRQNTCDLKTCVLDLAPAVVGCASAAAQLGVDPFSDAGCVISAVKDGVELPAACNGCIDQLGISGDVVKAENAISGVAGSIGDAIGGLF